MANIDPGNPDPIPARPVPPPMPYAPGDATRETRARDAAAASDTGRREGAPQPGFFSSEPATPETPTPVDVEAADKAAVDANAAADDARAKADAARVAAGVAAQARADAVDATRARWETIHEGTNERTERMVTPAGYWMRSVWRHLIRSAGGDPLNGSAMTFVPGDAPPLLNTSTVALSVADLQPGVDPEKATLANAYPITQLATAPTVLLFLSDGRVRVLKSPDPTLVGVTRPAVPADGPSP